MGEWGVSRLVLSVIYTEILSDFLMRESLTGLELASPPLVLCMDFRLLSCWTSPGTTGGKRTVVAEVT